MDSVTATLARICARPVDAAARERAALHVQDWIGCAAAGSVAAVGSVLRDWHRERPAGPSSILTGGSGTLEDACLINGALGNVLEMDDVHRAAILHPGPVVIPVALALAEAGGATAADFLDAVVRGYEAMIRVGVAAGRGHYAYWHPTSTCGVFGAAVAAASLLRLRHDQTVWALGNAGTQAAGLWQVRHEEVMSKQWHTGRAAQAGVQAADLARAGLTGPATILEGPQGFMAALGGGDAARVAADPDADWHIHEVSFKPWPACRHAHPAIDAALLLRERIGGRAIEAIEIRTYGDALRFCDRVAPASVIEAKFSLQHSVATVLAQGAPVLADFEPEALLRPAVAALRARATVAEDAGFEAAYPAHFGAEVRVNAGGERFTARVDDALGDPENPLDAAAIAAKARTLMAHGGWPGARIEATLAATAHLNRGGSVAALTANLP